jgi:hypothetical protein
MPSPFFEDFAGCTYGQPVTSDNTIFEPVDGATATICAQAREGLDGLGCRITEADSGGAPWTDAGLFLDEITGVRRLFFRAYVSVTSVTGPNLTFLWLSAPDDDTPIVSIGVNASEQLVGAGLALASGSATLGTFLRWSRVDVVVTESGDDLLVTADIYSGINLNSENPGLRVGQLAGTIAGGAALLESGAWLWLGRETTTTPTSATIAVDQVLFDATPQPPTRHRMDPGPGFFVVREGKLPRAELLGSWNGAGYDELEYFGRWNGSLPINPNWSFETGTEGWETTSPGGSISTTDAWAADGSYSMQIDGTGAATTVNVLTPALPVGVPTVENQWTFEGWMNPVSGLTRIFFRIYFYDVNGVHIYNKGVQSIIDPPVGEPKWLRVSVGYSENPVIPNATHARLENRVTGDDPRVYVDDMVFRYGPPGGADDRVDPIETFWLETWPVNGPIGPPTYTVNGAALSTSGGRTVPLAAAARGRALRVGPTSGDIHFGGLQARLPQSATVGAVMLDARMKDPATPTDESNDSYIRVGVSGSSALGLATFAVRIQATGASFSILTDIDYTQYYDLAVRLVGNVALGYVNRILIGSYALTTADIADLGFWNRLVIEGPATIGPIRSERL